MTVEKEDGSVSDDRDGFIEVSEQTMKMLSEIAKMLDCTVNAALEEAIREYALDV